jgi:hypothetical protein
LIPTFALLLGLPAAAHAQKASLGKRGPGVALPAATHAPGRFGPSDVGHETEWLAESRRLAEDAFEATQADPKELARTLRDVAKEAFHIEAELLRFMIRSEVAGWSDRLVKAEQSGGATAEEMLAALERRWLWTVLAEQQVAAALQSGRFGPEQALRARVNRLDAEIAWRRARAAGGKEVGSALPSLLQAREGKDELSFAARIARVKAEALDRSESDLKLAKREAARDQLAAFFAPIRSGRIVLGGEQLLPIVERWLEAEAAVHGEAADLAALAEIRWIVAKDSYDVASFQIQIGRIGRESLAAASYSLHEAELRWLQARAAASKKPSRQAVVEFFPDYWELRMAKAKFEAMQRTSAELLRGKLETARTVVKFFRNPFAFARIPGADRVIHEWWPRLLEAESAVARLEDRNDRLKALAANWRFLRSIEQSVQERIAAGVGGREEYLRAVYERLDAQLAWVRALAERKGK